jgi:hypothetical protein
MLDASALVNLPAQALIITDRTSYLGLVNTLFSLALLVGGAIVTWRASKQRASIQGQLSTAGPASLGEKVDTVVQQTNGELDRRIKAGAVDAIREELPGLVRLALREVLTEGAQTPHP